jgi:hypothetical protein
MGFVPARDDNAKIVRRCPYCAEMIRYNAIICKHCGKEIGELSADNEIKLGEPTETEFKFIVTDGETAFEPKALERISDKAVLYSSPNKSSGIIETFDIARTIELNKIDGEWLNVTVNKKISGWIYAPKYMEKLYSLEKC